METYQLSNTQSSLRSNGRVRRPRILTHPDDGVELGHGDLLGALHGRRHLLLVLLRQERQDLRNDRVQTLRDLSLGIKKYILTICLLENCVGRVCTLSFLNVTR